MKPSSAILVLTTTSSLKNARQIADVLLKHRLSACVSISSRGESHYDWKGKRCREREFFIQIKTRKTLFLKLRREILKVHAYEVPELIAIPILAGHEPYLDWVAAQTK